MSDSVKICDEVIDGKTKMMLKQKLFQQITFSTILSI